MPIKKTPGPYQRAPYATRGVQGNPVGFLLLLAQQIVQMEHRPPVTLGLVAGDLSVSSGHSVVNADSRSNVHSWNIARNVDAAQCGRAHVLCVHRNGPALLSAGRTHSICAIHQQRLPAAISDLGGEDWLVHSQSISVYLHLQDNLALESGSLLYIIVNRLCVSQGWQWTRLIWSAFLHADEVHLFYNMSSLLWKVRHQPRMHPWHLLHKFQCQLRRTSSNDIMNRD